MQRLALFLLIFLFPSIKAFADVNTADKKEIRQIINIIEQSLEGGDSTGIISLISPNASPNLKDEIEESLDGRKIHFIENDIGDWTSISPTMIRIKGSFSASASSWKMNGLGNYFVFERINGHWSLLDTDFYQKLSSKYWGGFFKRIMIFILPIFIIPFTFWIWMLVDCLNKPIKDKLVWVLVLIFLNLLGAILYFFIERKKVSNSEPS